MYGDNLALLIWLLAVVIGMAVVWRAVMAIQRRHGGHEKNRK